MKVFLFVNFFYKKYKSVKYRKQILGLKKYFSDYCIGMLSQPFFQKSLTKVLTLIFCVIPLVYAWFYLPWFPVTLADIFPGLNGFERIKVLSFISFVLVASILFLFSHRLSRQHWIWIGLFGIWSVFSYLVNRDINPYFWWWNGEKLHGWFLYCALFLLSIILSTIGQKEQKKILMVSLITGSIVCLYALFQKLWFDPMQSLYSSRLDETRIFSTLWNPNYLAGYILMLMPLALSLIASHKKLGWGLFGLLTLVLFLTKSLFGIGVFCWYGTYLLLYKLLPWDQKTRHLRALGLIGVGCLIAGYLMYRYGEHLLEIQKIKGFIARYFLWETGIRTIFGDIRNTLFGYGPDGFLSVSELFRSPELSLFEDPAYRIDRSHNVWIDMFIHFGIPVGVFLLYHIVSQWKKLSVSHREVLVLFSVFFFFNIPVIVHYLLLVQILMMTEPDQKQHS